MEKLFVTQKQSIELEELGFNETCFGGYELIDNGKLWIGNIGGNEQFNRDYYILAPLKQQVFRWFREKYNWTIKVNQVTKNNWSYTLDNFPKDRTYYGEVYKTYEEAESGCIDKLIEIVKNK
jgi:hypothetical protein